MAKQAMLFDSPLHAFNLSAGGGKQKTFVQKACYYMN